MLFLFGKHNFFMLLEIVSTSGVGTVVVIWKKTLFLCFVRKTELKKLAASYIGSKMVKLLETTKTGLIARGKKRSVCNFVMLCEQGT